MFAHSKVILGSVDQLKNALHKVPGITESSTDPSVDQLKNALLKVSVLSFKLSALKGSIFR